MQERDNSLSIIIETSIDIKTMIQSIDEKATNMRNQKTFTNQRAKAANLADSISELEMKINRMIGVTDCSDQNIIEIKNHLIEIY
jgi:hypothetical protein